MNAIYVEIKNVIINDSWDLVKRPKGKIVDSRNFLCNKYKADGTLGNRKVHVVAQGFTQRYGIECHDTFASVARLDLLRMT